MLEKYFGHVTSEIANTNQPDCTIFIKKLPSKGKKQHFNLKMVREKDGGLVKNSYDIKIKKYFPSFFDQIREIILKGVEKNLLLEGDKVFCITDKTLGRGFDGIIFIFKINKDFVDLTTKGLKKHVSKDIFTTTLKIAKEIGKEGREGRKVGTAFVIGDYDKLKGLTHQLCLNPFKGYPKEERKITDRNLKETVKELAQLDGVFLIDNDGVIRSASTYLNIDISDIKLPGLGTRHQACAALTKENDVIAICVSESGGKVRVFRKGNIVMKETPN